MSIITEISKDPHLFLDCTIDDTLPTISTLLNGGYLSIFMGTGVSMSAGFNIPDWDTFVKNCCDDATIRYDKSGNVLTLMDKVQTKIPSKDWIQFLHKNLYGTTTYNLNDMKTDLSVALMTLIVNSIKGGIKSIVNFNYDNLLQWYISSYGFSVNTVYKPYTLIGRADVDIYHPHGYIPLGESINDVEIDDIIISHKDYQRVRTSNYKWDSLLKQTILKNVILSIGLSGDDEHIYDLFYDCYNQKLMKDRILAFHFRKKGEKYKFEPEGMLERGIVCLEYDEYDDLPKYLMKISQNASLMN